MRWIHLGIIILFAAATIIFALQNFEIVTMSFLGINAHVPLALLVAIAYLLGAATGAACSHCCADRMKVQGKRWWVCTKRATRLAPDFPRVLNP
ncbi:hypothetical protein ACFIOY_10265 [Bradyrhizobium sp. TZ2]